MTTDHRTADQEREKLNEALRRGIPVTRMIDYGMRREDGLHVHTEVARGRAWDETLAAIADRDEAMARSAEAEGRRDEAAEHWHSAAMCLAFAQMIDNFDTDRKSALYGRMTGDFAQFARRSTGPVEPVTVGYGAGRLFGWHFHAAGPIRSAVITFGGLSGWATAYRSMAEALCARGIDCLLVDGPGQGQSRMEGGVFADAGVAAGISCFIDHVLEQAPSARVGLWGNSFGGLFAALTAVADDRVAACCVNGAPSRCEPPGFRTPAEQMAALFGQPTLEGLETVMATLTFDPKAAPVPCPVLILEGGADPLALPGSQDVFLEGNADPRSDKLVWPDGEHTIYNHAADRNHRVADWFAACLNGPP